MNLKYLEWSFRAYNKTAKNGDLCEELRSENDFEAVFVFVFASVVMAMVPRLLRLFRRLL